MVQVGEVESLRASEGQFCDEGRRCRVHRERALRTDGPDSNPVRYGYA